MFPGRWLLALVLAAGLPLGDHVQAAGPHVHGIGKLDVIAEGENLALRLESPLDNLVGFERAPRTDREKQAVRGMAAALRAETAFVPTREARCRVVSVKLESAVIASELLGEAGTQRAGEPRAAHAGQPTGGHAELVGDYVFQCANASALRGLEVRLFDSFKGLERLEVQVIGPRGQTGAKLTRKSRRISW
jgi:hypothetical protein